MNSLKGNDFLGADIARIWPRSGRRRRLRWRRKWSWELTTRTHRRPLPVGTAFADFPRSSFLLRAKRVTMKWWTMTALVTQRESSSGAMREWWRLCPHRKWWKSPVKVPSNHIKSSRKNITPEPPKHASPQTFHTQIDWRRKMAPFSTFFCKIKQKEVFSSILPVETLSHPVLVPFPLFAYFSWGLGRFSLTGVSDCPW